MLKKKKNEKTLEEKVESLTKQIAEMKSSYDELQFTYNKSRCHEQELIEQSKVAQKEKKEMEEKIRAMVCVSSEIDDCRRSNWNRSIPNRGIRLQARCLRLLLLLDHKQQLLLRLLVQHPSLRFLLLLHHRHHHQAS